MNEKIYNDVKEIITSLAETLKVTTDHVYEVLVRQQAITSYTILFSFIVCVTITKILYSMGVKEKAKEESAYENEYAYAPFYICSGIMFLITLLIALFGFDDMITGFMNPEYGAITEIARMFNR